MSSQIERENSKKYWDEIHKENTRDNIKIDCWLDKFINIINATKLPIIDLGCGFGNDTLYLIQKQKDVIPCDQSYNAISCIKRNFPEISQAECFDMLDGLPFDDEFCEVVIADLCLHYFTSADTEKIIADIYKILRPNGYLIFRVNSVNDINHGAGEGEEIERNLYKTADERLKRFFDEKDISFFFRNFQIEYVKETTMNRYKLEKRLYEGCVRKIK